MKFGLSKIMKALSALLLIMSITAPYTFALQTASESDWNRVSIGTRLQAIAWNGTTYVAVGDRSAIYHSADGESWSFSDSPVKAQLLTGVAWGNGTFVAVSVDGEIITSPDGTAWTLQRDVDSKTTLASVKWVNNQFVAIGLYRAHNNALGTTGLLMTSPDGIHWTDHISTVYDGFYGIEWANDQYVVVGTAGLIATSPDGVTWTRRDSNTSGSDHFYGVAWGNNTFVTVGTGGQIRTSADGVTWSTPTSASVAERQYFSSVIWANDKFVAIGASKVYTSTDGQTWTGYSYGLPSNSNSYPFGPSISIYSAVWGNDQYVAVGDQSTVISSGNGETWSAARLAAVSNNDLSAAAWGDHGFVAVGEAGTVVTSSDGIDWTLQNSGSTSWLSDVAWGHGLYAAVGESNDILTSPDGITWTPRTSAVNTRFFTIAWGNGTFVAGGADNTIQTSSDGVTWTARTAPAAQSSGAIRSIAWIGNAFIASTSGQELLTSADGVTWTARSTGISDNISHIVKGDGKYVGLTGTFGSVALSADGINWNTVVVDATRNFKDLYYIGGQYTLVDSWSYVYTSPDGENWTLQNSRASKWQVPLNDIVWGNDRLVAVGSWSLIYTAPLAVAAPQVGTVTGFVVDSNQNPISGATVRAGEASTTTNGQGAFTLPSVDTGAQTVTASAPGYLPGSQNVSVVSGQTADAGTIVLRAADDQTTGTVTGFVYDSEQSPISGATVRIGDIHTATNEQGAFTLGGIQEGSQTILASAAGYVDNSKAVSVTAGHTTDAGIVTLARPDKDSGGEGTNPAPAEPSVPAVPSLPTVTPAPVPTATPTATSTPAAPTQTSDELVQDPNDIFRSQVVRADNNVIAGVQARTAEILKAGAGAKTIDYSDISQHWAIASITKLTQLGVINGYPSGGFEPDDQITRAEFAAMITRAFVDMAGRNIDVHPGDFATLKDIDGHWSSQYLKKLVSVGVMNGYGDGTIRPEQTISRQEMAVIITRVLNPAVLNRDTSKVPFTDLNHSYAQEAIKKAAALGIFDGKTAQSFDPLGGATRAESIETIIKTYQLSPAIREALNSLK